MRFDRGARGEPQDERHVEAARPAELDVLQGGGQVKLRQLEQSSEAAVYAVRVLALDQQTTAILEAERADVRYERLFPQCLRHAEQAELAQALKRRL